MKKMRTLMILVCLAVVPAMAHALPFIDVEAAVGGWMQNPSGDMGISDSGMDGTMLDLESDMGFDGETNFSGRFNIDMPLVIPNIAIMATPMSFDGDGVLEKKFNFAGHEFDANVPYATDLTMDHFDVALYYGVPFLGLATLGTIGIDFGINVRLYQLEAEIRQNGDTVKESVDVPIPMAYLAAQIEPVDTFGIEAELRGLSIGDNKMFSAIGRVRYQVLGPAFVAGGWRHDAIDIDEEGFEIDTTFSGPFIEAGLKF